MSEKEYSAKELERIAIEHEKYFTRIKTWDLHAEKNQLPSSSCFVKHFGSWSDAKKEIFFQSAEDMKQLLTLIAKKHKTHFNTKDEWNAHAKEHSLPWEKTFAKHFGSWNEARRIILGVDYTENNLVHSKEALTKIAIEHSVHFASRRAWNLHATKHGLPYSSSYEKYFGTWNNAKESIFQGYCSSKRVH
ncbi:hypothetical protein QTG56_25765 (plasmid) [Rossellomorea sp. AcN35-11]|nr:hypothetical protein [Rossellomorea aquimaris]WJV32024.1 hypothetical protein QTG56_25765 [Rossellomorea sp. AcN35-11]